MYLLLRVCLARKCGFLTCHQDFVEGLDYSKHGQFDKVYGARHGALNSQQKSSVRAWLRQNKFRIQRLMVHMTQVYGEKCPAEKSFECIYKVSFCFVLTFQVMFIAFLCG